jgi:hypothetical protein
MRRDDHNCYYFIHNKIFGWVNEGLLEFDGKRSFEDYTDLDTFILKSFGYLAEDSILRNCSRLDQAIFNGILNVEWLFGEHGLALYKALLIRRGMK